MESSTDVFDCSFEPHSLDEWETLAIKTLPQGESLADLGTKTLDGLAIAALYTEHPAASEATHSLPTYQPRTRPVDNRISVVDTDRERTNKSVQEGLTGGAHSVELFLDDTRATSLTSSDLPGALEGVYLDVAPISLVTHSSHRAAVEQMERLWTDNNIHPSDRLAAFNVDPLDSFLTNHLTANELPAALDDLPRLAEQYSTQSPGVTVCSVNASRHHHSGASHAQELVAAMATATPYAEIMLDAKLSMQAISNTLVFRMACDSNFLMTVVKLRALKRLWSAVCKGLDPEETSISCNIAAETSKRMQATLSPWNNHLRNTSAAAAAIVGGASSITVTPHNFVNDQWINNESEVGVRIARNLPIILQEESLLASVEDPMAGSYAVEALTDELVDTVWESLKDMEKNGGWMHTLNSGQWSEALASSHRLRVESLKTKSSVRVGVNRFRADDSHPELRATSNPESPQVSSAQLVPVREAASFGA